MATYVISDIHGDYERFVKLLSTIKFNPSDKIYKKKRHIAIDCGCGYGGLLGAICLENLQEFYV